MIEYPPGMPYPLREGYGFEQTNNISRTQMASGRSRQRVEFKDAPPKVRLNWLMTNGEAAVFEYWSSQMVGAGWFSMPIKTPLSLDDCEIRFTEAPEGPVLFGANHWKFTALCELRARSLLPPDWVEILPGFVILSDIFDFAINQDWPDFISMPDIVDFAINQEWPES